MEEDDYSKEWERQVAYIQENKDMIRAKYGNKFIAFGGNQVVDSDEDELALAIRIRLNFKGKPIFISTLEEILNPGIDYQESSESEC